MDTKITLTFYDVVSHLIPGTALLLSFRYFGNIGKDIPSTEAILYLLVFGYITGLLLHLIGLLLFKPFFIEDHKKGTWKYACVYAIDKILAGIPLLKTKSVDVGVKEELAKAIDKKWHVKTDGNRLGLFSVADTYIAALPFAERDILHAKEGVFRSLAVLVIIETIYLSFFVYQDHRPVILFVGVILLELARYGREHYRVIKNQQIYTLSLIKLKND